MKKDIVRYGVVFLLFSYLSCNSSKADDCFKTTGVEVSKVVELEAFSSILINREVEAVIQQGDVYKVEIISGDNLINDVAAEVINGKLVVTDNNTCNFFRSYGATKVIITAPDLQEIRTSTQYDISSNGLLNYSNLALISEDFNNPNNFAVGDFRLQLSINNLKVTGNNISSFYLEGEVDRLNLGFFDGEGRFEGASLIVNDIEIFHRGSNDLILNPQQSITGQMMGTGNVMLVNEPPVVDVEVLYTGQFIISD